MPFLFDREALKPKGRRTFDKRGHEVEEAEQKADDQPPQAQPNGHTPDNHSKGVRRPISISGFPSAVHKLPTKDVKKIKDPSKTAKQIIRDTSGVGTDLRVSRSSIPQINSLGKAFLKPSGVDEPTDSTKGSTSDTRDNDIISGARPKATKRERETVSEPKEKEGKKRKKKKIVE